MSDISYLDWHRPRHRELALTLDAWAKRSVSQHHGNDVDDECRADGMLWVQDGWLSNAVAGRGSGAAPPGCDTRAICLIRETLARHSGLADFVAMQGLGSVPWLAHRQAESALPDARCTR